MEKIVLEGDASGGNRLVELMNVLFPECEIQILEQDLDNHQDKNELLASKARI